MIVSDFCGIRVSFDSVVVSSVDELGLNSVLVKVTVFIVVSSGVEESSLGRGSVVV